MTQSHDLPLQPWAGCSLTSDVTPGSEEAGKDPRRPRGELFSTANKTKQKNRRKTKPQQIRGTDSRLRGSAHSRSEQKPI